MNLLESLRVALEGISANKVRAGLTMLGIIIGVGAVIAMLAIGQGAKEQMMQRIQQMGTNVLMVMPGQTRQGGVMGGFGSSQTLTLDDMTAISKKCLSVVACAAESRGNYQVKYRNQNTNTSVIGVTANYGDVRDYSVDDGRFINDSDVKSLKEVALIGHTTATNLFGDIPPVGKTIMIRGINFTIIGQLAVKGANGFQDQDDTIFIPITTSMRRVIGTRYVRMISAQAQAMELSDQAISEISTLLRRRHKLAPAVDDDFIIRNQADIVQMAEANNQTFTWLLAGIASVSLLVGGIGIMNIMLVSVTERTREIGIRMALGARRRDILSQFLIESMALSLLGGFIGIMLGLAGSWAMGQALGWNVSVSAISIVVSFLFSALVGVIFGVYPARQASRLDPIEALRYE